MPVKYIIVGKSLLGLKMLKILSRVKVDYHCLGYLDDQGPSSVYWEYGIPYLGKLDQWDFNSEPKVLLVQEDVRLRMRYEAYISESGGSFLSFIHPSAEFGKNVTKGEGIFVGPDCYIGDYCHLGSFCILVSKNFVRKFASIGLFCILKDKACLGEGLSLGNGNCLGKRTILRSVSSTLNDMNLDVDEQNFLWFKSKRIPWYNLN